MCVSVGWGEAGGVCVCVLGGGGGEGVVEGGGEGGGRGVTQCFARVVRCTQWLSVLHVWSDVLSGSVFCTCGQMHSVTLFCTCGQMYSVAQCFARVLRYTQCFARVVGCTR